MFSIVEYMGVGGWGGGQWLQRVQAIAKRVIELIFI